MVSTLDLLGLLLTFINLKLRMRFAQTYNLHAQSQGLVAKMHQLRIKQINFRQNTKLKFRRLSLSA